MRIRTKATRHGEITVPQQILEHFNVKAGDMVEFEVENNRVLLHFGDADPLSPRDMRDIIRGWDQIKRGDVVTFEERIYRD